MVKKTSGILMSSEMIRAYKAGLKSQTRRTRGLDVVNEKPADWIFEGFIDDMAFFSIKDIYSNLQYAFKSPYGLTGDTLWFKETHAVICREAVPTCECENEKEMMRNHYVEYRADTNNRYPGEWPEDEAKGNGEAPKWKPSIFMRHDYSRFKDIPILKVRVERLQDISCDDIRCEGATQIQGDTRKVVDTWITLWNSINEKCGMGWHVNPWVWVYEFSKFGGV